MNKKIQKEIKKIRDIIVKKYQPEKIILFGSAARGEIDESGDLDFFIIKKDPQGRIARSLPLRKIITSEFPLDFLVYTPSETKRSLKWGDPFIKSIFQEGKILYD